MFDSAGVAINDAEGPPSRTPIVMLHGISGWWKRTILKNVGELSSRFAAERHERQQRRALIGADFAALRAAGFLFTGVPVGQGGVWEDVRRSARPICEMLRILAHGDPAIALVCAMHPTVLSSWLASPGVAPSFQDAWTQQRGHVFETARDGAWWGTITSEPGSGGDLLKTKAAAKGSATVRALGFLRPPWALAYDSLFEWSCATAQ